MDKNTLKYMVIENIATMIICLMLCKLLGVWGLVVLLNISYPKTKK